MGSKRDFVINLSPATLRGFLFLYFRARPL
jgi:hypothetical protein